MTTLLDLRTRAYQLMDEGLSQYLGTAEMNNYVNNAASMLHNIIGVDDPWRMIQSSTVPLTVGQTSVPLPVPIMRLMSVIYSSSVQPGGWKLHSFNPSQASEPTGECFYAPIPRYFLAGNNLLLNPAPTTAGSSLTLQYAPQYQPLVADTDVLPAYQLNGHEQWIVNGAVIYAKTKEEVSSQDLQLINAQIMSQIMKMLQMRDRNSGNVIVEDTSSSTFSFPQYRFNY